MRVLRRKYSRKYRWANSRLKHGGTTRTRLGRGPRAKKINGGLFSQDFCNFTPFFGQAFRFCLSTFRPFIRFYSNALKKYTFRFS